MPIKTRGGHLPSLEREVLRNCRRSQLTLPSAWGEEPREYLRDQCKAALAHGSVSACLGLRASSPGTRSIHGGTRAERPADSHRKSLALTGTRLQWATGIDRSRRNPGTRWLLGRRNCC